jgi:hypothetical protein
MWMCVCLFSEDSDLGKRTKYVTVSVTITVRVGEFQGVCCGILNANAFLQIYQ